MDHSVIKDCSYILAAAATTAVLIWGLKRVDTELKREVVAGSGKTVMNQVLSEKGSNDGGASEAASFSRVSGALGAVGIAATFVGIGYWALYGLFYEHQNLTSIQSLSTYFLAGSALFLPYAFNRLSDIFK